MEGGKEHLVGWRRECKEKKTETIINERYTKKDECDTASNNFMIAVGDVSLTHIIYPIFSLFQIHPKNCPNIHIILFYVILYTY